MLKSYLTTALRFLKNNKVFGLINIIGLAIGTLSCLYILLYVRDQYSYDQFGGHAKDIYRITSSLDMSGDRHQIASVSPPIAPGMKADFPEVAQFTRAIPTLGASEHLISYKEKSIYETDALLVDSTFFDVFPYHFVAGKSVNTFKDANTIVLLQPLAQKLFGNENAIGKVITIDDAWGKSDFLVTAVVDESLGKCSLRANMFIKLNPGGYGGDFLTNNNWSGNNYSYSYIKLKPAAKAGDLERLLPAFLKRHGEEQLRYLGMKKILHLQPLADIHTNASYESESSKTVGSSFLYLLILIAVLIQVIACINFMNLSTARASKRAKEVGIRKVVGAGRKSLIAQFIGESFLLSLLSVMVSIPLLALTIPYLNGITQADIHLSSLMHGRVWLIMGAVILVTGFAAGSYPAFYLSAFQAIKVIKGNFTNHVSAAGIRRSLVVFQFALSIILITGIIIIYSQLEFIKHMDLGFDKTQQIIFSFHTNDTKNKMTGFESDLLQLPEVKTASKANNYPGAESYNDWKLYLSGGNVATGVDQQNISADENIAKTLGVRLISGSDFHVHDSLAVIINETLAKRLGLKPPLAMGARLFSGEADRIFHVVAVMKDFNYRSLRNEVYPFMLIYNPASDDIGQLIVKVNSNNYPALLDKMGKIWHKNLPATPFAYMFLDDEIQRQYESEVSMGHIINSFTAMAILISCLGLFGLATFSAEQRNKEIGIRKVLGASVAGIVQLLSADFLKLVLVAFIIATPISWWAMNQWLQGFAYRIPISWWMFALAGLLAIFIALFTISFQAIKAAVGNPVKSLRSE
jgi:putative ABC transport system permease protein